MYMCVYIYIYTYIHVHNLYVHTKLCVCNITFGWHYLSNATCLIRPRVFYACFVVSGSTTTCCIIRHFEETCCLDK